MRFLLLNDKYQTFAALLIFQIFIMLIVGCGGIIDPEAEEILRQKLGNTSFTVYPAYIRYGDGDDVYDIAAAESIGQFLEDEDLATVTISEEQVPLREEWHSNEARMFRESTKAFASYILENPIVTEYGLLAEYLFLAGSGAVGGIHCYILEASGRVAFAVGLNSHHEPFYTADPQSIEDCTAVLISVLRDELISD
jgi:hypothetical protein